MAGRKGSSLCPPGGRGRLPVIGGIDIRLVHLLPGKLAEGHAPPHPFDKLSGRRCSDLKIRTVTSWDRGKYAGRSIRWVGCRWSRPWSSGECSESRTTAILGGLIIEARCSDDDSLLHSRICLVSIGIWVCVSSHKHDLWGAHQLQFFPILPMGLFTPSIPLKHIVGFKHKTMTLLILQLL